MARNKNSGPIEKFTVYMPADLFWRMREFGVSKKLKADSEMANAAVEAWVGYERKSISMQEGKHEEAAPQVKRRRA